MMYLPFFRWLYSLILAIDANFHLKNKDKHSKNDPELGDGWAYWVPKVPYLDYVKKYGDVVEVSHHVRCGGQIVYHWVTLAQPM